MQSFCQASCNPQFDIVLPDICCLSLANIPYLIQVFFSLGLVVNIWDTIPEGCFFLSCRLVFTGKISTLQPSCLTAPLARAPLSLCSAKGPFGCSLGIPAISHGFSFTEGHKTLSTHPLREGEETLVGII